MKVWRDATLLVVTRGRSGLRVSINIRPAPQDYVASQLLSGKLAIGSTAYWVFDAQLGDVMKFASEATGFASHISVLDPELREVTQIDMPIDHSDLTWDFFATKPGRYLVAMSAIGDGGAGDYTLECKTYAPREFGVAVTAQDKLGAGDVHVWKLAAKPGEPLLVRWSVSNFSYSSDN